MIKHIFCYVKSTHNYALEIASKPGAPVFGFSDSDWAGDHSDCKSTTRYAFYVFGALVSWNSHKQPTIALSSTEAEYMALTEAAKEAIWLCSFLAELGYVDDKLCFIYGDNQGSIELSRNPHHHSRTKHIDICHHFICECVESKQITVSYISTQEQVADIFTKPLTCDKFINLCQKLGMIAT